MSYEIKYSDITKYKGDVIVNSVGTNTTVYGRLCRNILDAAGSEEIKNTVNNYTGDIGDIFITKAGKLPANEIYHVITSYKFTDANCEILTSIYRKLVNLAIKNNKQTIALPFLGTGANGYSEYEAYNALLDVCEEIDDLEEKENRHIIKITVIGYLKRTSMDEEYSVLRCDRLLPDGDPFFSSVNTKMISKGSIRKCNKEMFESSIESIDSFNKYLSINECIESPRQYSYNINNNSFVDYYKVLADVNYNEFIEINPKFAKIYSPYDYVELWIEHHNYRDIEKKLFRSFASERKNELKNKHRKINLQDIFRLSFCLGMSKSETIQFLVFSGIQVGFLDPISKIFINYLSGKYGITCQHRDLMELENIIDEETNGLN